MIFRGFGEGGDEYLAPGAWTTTDVPFSPFIAPVVSQAATDYPIPMISPEERETVEAQNTAADRGKWMKWVLGGLAVSVGFLTFASVLGRPR